MKIYNDTFRIIMKIMRKKYPSKKAKIYFVDKVEPYEGKKAAGLTFFSAKNDKIPVIMIDTSLSLSQCTMTLAHELAHVIVGKNGEKNDHGKKWKKTFYSLRLAFAKEIKKVKS